MAQSAGRLAGLMALLCRLMLFELVSTGRSLD
jgi:hypothetical protein